VSFPCFLSSLHAQKKHRGYLGAFSAVGGT